jgi:NAD(P)-dependent dehydrogenase (short-subunit alcohol dehydrogenase family)
MDLHDTVIVITGGGRGIGAAMARRFAAERPRGIVIGDLDPIAAARVATEVGGVGIGCDVSTEEGTIELIEVARHRYGPVDVFCANAGIAFEGDVDLPDADWQRMLGVNFLAHVYAARHLVPEWTARGGGYLVVTASAAGLLTSLGSAPYAVTKHAALAFAEWVAITHGDAGVKVSAVCPQGVNTAMLEGGGALNQLLRPEAVEPEKVADDVVDAIRAERFLVLPHPEVERYFQKKANDYERWLGSMRKLNRQARDWIEEIDD